MNEIEQARQVLEDAGYQVTNLWHIDDIKDNYDCTDEEAMEILVGAIKHLASNVQNSTVTMFKGELTTEIPTNKMFEITNILREEKVKSGKEKRRERRKQGRKKKGQ